MGSSLDTVPKGCLIDGDWIDGADRFDVLNKFTLDPAGTIAGAAQADVNRAIDAAYTRFEAGFPPPYERSQILLKVRDLVADRREAFATIMSIEAGFPIKDARGETDRALQTITLSAEEAKRLGGEAVPFEGAPTGTGRIGFTMRVPLGLVCAITPFNSPLNTVCHKVAPAFAGGNAVILKPSDKTPLTAALLAQCIVDAGAPRGALTLLHGGIPVAQALLADPRIAFYAFTGSTAAGKAIQAAAGVRRTQMELGSIASSIVLSDADVENAAQKCIGASFRKAGQVCTSIQTLMVQDDVYDAFRTSYISKAKALVCGDPADERTDVGPMISEVAAERVMSVIDDLQMSLGGMRDRSLVSPTIVENVPAGHRMLTEEIFGPITCLIKVSGLDEAIKHVNATPYGLATGVFTSSINNAFKAARRLRVGGVHINETCSSRVDLMPYGGVKDSGFGHEGPKYAIREMTEERLVTFSGLGE